MAIEVEIRGPLTQRKYQGLFKFLEENGKLIKEAEQTAIFFRTEKHNLSLKKDHDKEKLVLKFGDWGRGSRKEIEVFLQNGQFDNALELLKGLGYNKDHCAPSFRQDYSYKGTQISLKTKAVIGPHYEMETTVERKNQEKTVRKKLLEVAGELGLRIWTDNQYKIHTHQMWQRRHPGPEDL